MDVMQTETEYDPVNLQLPDRELMHSGHFGCPGCGAALGMRLALKALGENTIMAVAAGCWGTLNGPYPFAPLKVPVLEVPFATTAISAAGIRAGLDVQGKHDVTLLPGQETAAHSISVSRLSPGGRAQRSTSSTFATTMKRT